MQAFRPWTLAALAIGIASALVIPFVATIPALRNGLIVISAASALLVIASFVKRLIQHDPYSLDTLLEVHNREEIRFLIDSQEKVEEGEVVCLACGCQFPIHLPVCPECRCTQGTRHR